MAMENDKIKDLFSSKLGNFEPEVPASLWGGLDQLLSQQPAPVADGSSSASSSSSSSSGSSASSAGSAAGKASVIKTVLITVGVAAAVVAGVILIPKGDNPSITEDTPPVVVDVDTVKQESITVPEDTIVMPQPVQVHKPMVAKMQMQEEEVKPQDNHPVVPSDEPVRPKPEEKKPEQVKEKQDIPLVAKADEERKVVKSKRSKAFSVGLVASSEFLTRDARYNSSTALFSQADRSEAFVSMLDREENKYDLKHDLPISFGLKVSKEIAPNLALETGVVYTYLSSKVTSDNRIDINESQSFHYLGIPLSLNYTFYQLGNAKFYLSAGGMIQKDISGKYVSHVEMTALDISEPVLSDIYYSEPYYMRENIEQSRPQFSAHARMGVSYPIYRKLYIYGTVGGAYYFDAKNKYRTIYSDRKTQLDINLGIKFDF